MQTIKTVEEYNKLYTNLPKPIALVPTMGFLHEGHLSLVRKARQQAKTVVVSIFVNPSQFAPGEDYDKYPVDYERDLSLLEEEAVDVVFAPHPAEIYPEDFDTWVDVNGVTAVLEGTKRPTHFRGVTTVVAKLFNIIRPDVAYFGQKDAQQAVVIKKMVKDLSFNISVKVLPIIREADGLAMSSRNTYLNDKERKAATVLYSSLKLAKTLYDRGETSANKIISKMTDLIKREPLAKIDYVSIANADTLAETEQVSVRTLVSLAVYIGKTRLIDNILLG